MSFDPVNITPAAISWQYSSRPPVASRDIVETPAVSARVGAEAAKDVLATGRLYALKDGSGYAIKGSDGRYYQVQAGAASGPASTGRGTNVSVTSVDVVHGPVNYTQVQQLANEATSTAGAQAVEPMPELPVWIEIPYLGPMADEQQWQDPVAHSTRATRALMQQNGAQILSTHAHTSQNRVLALLLRQTAPAEAAGGAK